VRQKALLDGVRVVEIAGRPSIRFAAMVLAELGADVTRVQPQNPGDGVHPLASERAVAAAWDQRKQIVEPGHRRRVVATADVLLTSADSGARNPFAQAGAGVRFAGTQVHATPFGTTGPYRHYVADDLNLVAFGGAAVFVGQASREPLAPPFMMAAEQSGLAAVVAVLAALRNPGAAHQVDIAEYEVLATNHMTGLYSLSFFLGPAHRRAGHRKPNPYPFTILPCRDGQVCLAFLSGHQWRRLIATMGDPEWAAQERFSDRRRMGALHADELDVLVSEWLSTRTRAELRDIAVDTRLPLGPLQRLEDLPRDRQLAHRRFWQHVGGSAEAGVVTAGLPFRDMVTDAAGAQRAPREHSTDEPPLRGVRVLDLSWVMSGPMSSQILTDLGADVMKVESVTHLDSSREGLPLSADTNGENGVDNSPNVMHYFNNVNRGKRSVALNLRTGAGRTAFLQLVQTADVLVENIGAGALERLGISCEQLHALNPALVILRISMSGQDGPDASLPGYAPQSTAVGGLDALCGYAGQSPTGMIALNYGDVSVAFFGAIAALAALRRAERTGQGTVLDLSMVEAHVTALGPILAAHQLGEIPDAPVGNDHRTFFPHDMYRCNGDDEWISISIKNAADWSALCDVTDASVSLRELDASAQRRAHQQEITAHLQRWAANRDSASAFHRLQAAGVCSAPAYGAEELMIDEHVNARANVVGIEHHLLGYLPIYGTPVQSTPELAHIYGRAPDLGEHTLTVLQEAGVADATIADWIGDGAFDGVDIGLTGATP